MSPNKKSILALFDIGSQSLRMTRLWPLTELGCYRVIYPGLIKYVPHYERRFYGLRDPNDYNSDAS